MAEIFLKRLTGAQADLQRDAIADMYAKTYRRSPGVVLRDRAEFLERFADDVRQPGFEMVLAGERVPVGCAYGYRVDRREAWWTDRFAWEQRGADRSGLPARSGLPGLPAVPAAPTVSAVPDEVFVVAELMVLPARRRNHLATRLQHRLLAPHTGLHAAILLERANVPARSACREWGWHRAGSFQVQDRTPVMEVWSRVPAG